ncbi:LysR family transcriptional regulator [Nevskia ramosa]|uniref:LysR family transcriptional regulator n=1 Tax=Nevskia ramosa TaxID=64002 RepID=UPI0003B35DAD|nr:LysR family transcriptional regulator [Nevskia ramosa]
MNNRFFSLRLFSRVARLRSFSLAGRELGLSQPSSSRIISELEKEVGATLLTRTTRGVTLTEAGRDYLDRIEPILIALEEADHAARGTGELRGILRIAVSTPIAVRELAPRLPAFMDRHPALRVSLQMSDQRQDLVNESIDVGLRFGVLTDSNAVAQPLGQSRRLLVASPAYLARAGTPESPGELASHSLIVGPSGATPAGWSFQRNGRTTSIRAEGRLIATVNEGATAAAVAGLGIMSTLEWGCRAELASGALVEVMVDWKMETVDIHAVFPAGRAAKPSARAFVDYFRAALSEQETGVDR